ncbi:hypothetical protein GQX74_011095 [Glossina fuscipes]|nr:hypothetical protein GQX74_011095 [Glossina fuscipes]
MVNFRSLCGKWKKGQGALQHNLMSTKHDIHMLEWEALIFKQLENQFQLLVIISSNLILKFIAINRKKKNTITTVYERTELINPASSKSNFHSTFGAVNANNTSVSITKWIDLIDFKVQKASEVIEEDVFAPKTFYSTRNGTFLTPIFLDFPGVLEDLRDKHHHIPTVMFAGFGIALRDLTIAYLHYAVEGFVGGVYGENRGVLDCEKAPYCHYREKLFFLIFAEERLMISFNEKLNDWRAVRPEVDFRLLLLQFPFNSEREWRNPFKSCAAQRLYLPVNDDLKFLFKLRE